MRRYVPSPLNATLERCERLGLGHRPDVDVVGMHFSTCPVCGCPDALVIFEPDDGEPVEIRCAEGCSRRWVAKSLAGIEPLEQLREQLLREHMPTPTLLRRQSELLAQLAVWREGREAAA